MYTETKYHELAVLPSMVHAPCMSYLKSEDASHHVIRSWQTHSLSRPALPHFHYPISLSRPSLLSNHTHPTKWYVLSPYNLLKGWAKEKTLTIPKAPAATGGKKQKKKWSKGKGT